jgi:parallel beta-helix repeat protein
MHYLFTIQSTKAQTSFAKQTIVFLIGILLSITSQATNYYFSSSTGNDSYTSTQAQNQATPWKSIAKLNSFFSNIVAGDIIYLKRGDIFYGQIVINKSGTSGKPILITAYGSGNKPVLTGFTTISAWVNEGSGIYSSTISSPTQTNMVAIDNVQYAMGRYPDATYRTFQSFVTNISITDNTLGTGTNWTGAEVVIRKNDWTIDRCRITAHSGNTLSYYSLGSAQSPYANFGYFIQNDLRTLTTYGEWFHNINNGKFYMYFGSVSPSTKVVQVATTNNVIAVGGYDYITLDNLNIKGSIDNGIQYSGGNDYCVVQNCDVVFGGKVGIGYSTGNGSIINNNTVKYCNGGGINSDGTSSTITNNTVANIGNFKGQALGGSYNGIGVVGNGVVVRNNYVHNIGATGINLKYTGAATIQYNLIDTVCTLLDDGAGIYTSGSNTSVRLIDHNIIMNVVGNSEGTNNNSPLSAGIFLDEKSTNVVISNNTIANVPYNGIKFHHSTNNTITDNTTYNNNYGIYFQSSSVAGTLNNQMRRNIFFAKLATQYSMQYYTDVNSLYTLASDSNYFVRPMEPNLCVQYQQPSTNYYWINSTIPAWTTISGEDVHSKKSPKTITNLSDLNFQYNASGTSKVVPFAGLSYVDATGTVYNNSVTIPAWGSKVLIANGLATTSSAVVSLLPAVNPAYTINGLDYKYYEGSWSVLPAFSTLTPIKTGNTTNFTTAVANRSTQYGLNFTGYINVPADGQYTFYTSSDDGSSLYIDNNLVVTNDGIHPTTEKSGTIGLKAGKHAINGLFFQADGGQVFAVSYSSTSIPKQVIPASALYRVNLRLLIRQIP